MLIGRRAKLVIQNNWKTQNPDSVSGDVSTLNVKYIFLETSELKKNRNMIS